jgi:hypothetical protein
MIKGAVRFIAILALLPSVAFAAISVHTTDFIPDNTRTNFNGFEAIGPQLSNNTFTGGTYTEDGITVENLVPGGVNNNIATTCIGPGFCFNPTHEGSRSWYPDGGDFGYTRITRAGGADFINVGFILGSGFGGNVLNVYYELAKNSAVVASGQLPGFSSTPSYLGFSGGGFNEIRIRNGFGDQLAMFDDTKNALAIDSIEASGVVPEPATYGMMACGLAFLMFLRARRTR